MMKNVAVVIASAVAVVNAGEAPEQPSINQAPAYGAPTQQPTEVHQQAAYGAPIQQQATPQGNNGKGGVNKENLEHLLNETDDKHMFEGIHGLDGKGMPDINDLLKGKNGKGMEDLFGGLFGKNDGLGGGMDFSKMMESMTKQFKPKKETCVVNTANNELERQNDELKRKVELAEKIAKAPEDCEKVKKHRDLKAEQAALEAKLAEITNRLQTEPQAAAAA